MSQAAQNLNWLITNFVDNTPGVSHTVVVSADGLLLAMSEGFPRDRADQREEERWQRPQAEMSTAIRISNRLTSGSTSRLPQARTQVHRPPGSTGSSRTRLPRPRHHALLPAAAARLRWGRTINLWSD